MNNAVTAGVLVLLGLVPALLLGWWMRRSPREPSPGPTYAAAGMAVLVGSALAYGVREALGARVGMASTLFAIAAGGFLMIRGELGRVQASWRARHEEEAGPA